VHKHLSTDSLGSRGARFQVAKDVMVQDGSTPATASNSRQSSANTSRSPSCDYSRIIISADDLDRQAKIGFGSTAEVYRGLLRGQPVAIKSLLVGTGPRGAEREVNVLSKVDHPNLTQVHGLTLSADSPLPLVSELCEGGSLFEKLHIQSDWEFEWWQQLKMCNDIAGAIGYLHGFEPQIVHRDLKTLNILLSRPVRSSADTPVIKVTDFGLSKFRELGTEMTKGVGSPHWMAPECFVGTNYDEKVDVFSFGIVLFEIICCEPPYEDKQHNEIEAFVRDGGRPDLEEAIPPDCPREMQELITDCWAQDPKTRPVIDDVIRALRRVKVPL
jgi:serine/threonine protein kinase